ncbi:MAG: hypothetical protein IKA45_08390 [Bacteroidales bacterium]|nr:hypothetical protein [Bacteroidales bacterium]
MKKILTILVSILIMVPFNDAISCTSAIFTGKVTKDGRPLLLKHRDTGELNNRIEYFQGPKYGFLALVDSPSEGGVAWSGSNNAGFSIINTASYNLKDDDVPSSMMDREGELMYKALGVCKNLKDFEYFLDTLSRPMGVEGNFGVIDAEGGAAYYEVNNHKWNKLDVNDPEVAPNGYFIVTNFSYTGREDEGMGYIRNCNTTYNVENYVLKEGGKVDPQWIFENISRSFYHSLLEVDLRKDQGLASGWFIDQDFVPRRSSSASMVFQGVKPGEDVSKTVMWTILGYPPLGVAVPMVVANGENIPSFMVKSESSENALMCDMVLELKKNVFPVKRGNGNKYFRFNYLYNKGGTGYSQQLKEVENYIFDKFDRDLSPKKLNTLYDEYFGKIEKAYENMK